MARLLEAVVLVIVTSLATTCVSATNNSSVAVSSAVISVTNVVSSVSSSISNNSSSPNNSSGPTNSSVSGPTSSSVSGPTSSSVSRNSVSPSSFVSVSSSVASGSKNSCPGGETYCNATHSCQKKNACFDCCRHVKTFCETVETFGKICKGLSAVCPHLGREHKHHHHASASHHSHHSHHMTASLTNAISITVMNSGVVITQSGTVSAGVSNGNVSAGASSGAVSAGVSSGVVSAGVSSAAVSAGVSSAAVSAGVSSAAVSAGVSSAAVSAGVSSAAVSAGVSSAAVSAGVSSGAVSAGASSAAVSASGGSLSMSWPSIVTTAFGSMIATVSPSAHHSHALMSSHAHHGSPWWSKHNISESMERWLRYIANHTDCGRGKKFCPLKLQCIPDNEPCTIHLSNDKLRNLSSAAWCVNCSSNQYFCPLFMQCIDANQSCSYNNLYKWSKAGNSSNSSRVLSDIKCGFNETFSFKTMSCQKKDPLQQREEHGHECGHKEIFCPFSASCRNKTDCVPFPRRNYSSALENDTFGWAHMCQIRNLVCPRVARTLVKCDRDRRRCNLTSSRCPKGKKPCKYDDSCISVNTTCCPKGEYFCNKSNRCMPKKKMCCPLGQERCKFTGACGVPLNCVANTTFPTVWKYLPLGHDLSKGIFKAGDAAVALLSVKMHGVNGSLEFYDLQGKKWKTVQDISPSNALVLGKSNYLRFVSASRYKQGILHGIVLVNFTAYSNAAKIGQNVDASSLTWRIGNTLTIFEMPLVIPPNIVYNGSIFTVDEDSDAKDFDISDQLYNSSPDIDKKSHIPDDVVEDLNRHMVEFYKDLLNEIDHMDLWVEIRAPSEKLLFKGKSARASIKSKPKIQFKPKQNFNGNVTYTLHSYLSSPNKSYMALASYFSPEVALALKVIPAKKANDHRQLFSLGKKVLLEVMKNGKEPNDANVLQVVKDLRLNASEVEKLSDLVKNTLNKFGAPGLKEVFKANKRVELVNGAVKYNGNVIRTRIFVKPVNDRPVIKRNSGDLQPVPYDLNVTSYTGTLVKDVFRQSKAKPLVEDVDDRKMDVGVAVLAAGNNSFGQWQYKMNDSMPYKDFNFTKKVQVMLLPPEARIKLKLYNPRVIWSGSDAFKRRIFVQVKAWDMSDNRKPGIYAAGILKSGTSFSEKFTNLLLLRQGCDNRTDFAAVKDRCGVCRGRNKCVKCDKQPNSNARINKCGFCTGGSTGLNFTHKVDCAGQCDKNIKDAATCNICMNKNKIRNLTDCTGTCFGKARKNKCGNCAGGQSGRPTNYGADLCNKCGGDNSTCADCNSVPNGKSKIDFCKKCRKEDDANFNTGCSSFGAFEPVSGEHGAETAVTLRGAGFKTLDLTSCEFNDTATSQKYSSSSSNKPSSLAVKVKAPANLPVGTYSILCTFKNNLKIETKNTVFTVYNRSTISVSSISPSEAEIGSPSFNVTITGTGFVDTGYLACARLGTSIKLKGYYVSATQATCTFTNTVKSALFNVSLVFGKNDPPVALPGVEFSLYAVQPEPLSIRFQDNPSKMLLTFDKKATLRTANPSGSCSPFFDQASLDKLASKSKCKQRARNQMVILLIGSGATIAPGQTLNFTNGSLATLREKNTKFVSGSTTLTVGSSPNPPVPRVKIQGPKEIGPCASFEINTITRKGGGRPMTFNWYVNEKPGADANTTKDMQALNATLLNETLGYITIGSAYIVRNVEYEIVVKATNFLGKSTEAILTVTRKTKGVPEVELSSTGESMLRSQRRMIRAKVSLPGCNGSDANSFSYVWGLKDSNGDAADLGSDVDLRKPYLVLEGKNLNGGENYTLCVNVFDAADPDITVTACITVEVESSDLIARIKGGVSFDIGFSDDLTLDGGNSKDPDKSSEDEVYIWSCKDSDGYDCLDNNNKRVIFDNKAAVTKKVSSFLETAKTYTFTLTYRKGVRSAETSVTVRVKGCSPPKVTIDPQKKEKTNTEDPLLIKGKFSVMATEVTLVYSFVSEDELVYVEDLSTVAANNKPITETIKSKTNKRPFVRAFGFPIKADVLEPGTYKFRVSANTTSCSSYSETKFTVNNPPFPGTISITPSSGTALDTEFTCRVDLFTDDDGPLKYKFGFYSEKDGKTVKNYVGFKNPQKRKLTTLAQGESDKNNTVRIFVEAYDDLGASVTVEKTVIVNPKVFSLSDLQDLKTSGAALEESGELENQLGTINTVVSAVGGSNNVSDDVKEAVNELKKSYSLMAVNVWKNVAGDPDAERNALNTMDKTTEGGADTFDDSSKDNMFAVFKELHKKIDSLSRRRRRAVNSEILDVDPVSAADAESTLKPPSNLIAPAVYTQSESTRKNEFLELVDTIGLKVCAGQGTGSPAVFANAKMVSMRAETRNFDDIGSTSIDMSCSDCSPAKMKLGSSLEDKYNAWSCATGETCSGACLLSTQYPEDLLYNQTDASRLTDVVDVKFYNPTTKKLLSVGSLANPATFLIPLKSGKTFPNGSYVECKLWSSGKANWTTTGCTSGQSAVVSGNVSYVECNCTTLGYLSAFVGPATTAAPVTQAATTAAPTTASCDLEPKDKGVNVTFSFNVSYSSVISNSSQKASVQSALVKAITDTLKVDDCSIQDFSLTSGSIKVSFIAVPAKGQTTASLQTAIAKLETKIKSGDFNVRLPGGAVLSADPSSFVATPVTPPTTPAPPAPTEATTDSGGLSETNIIIIACVCGGVALIVIIGITVYCCKKKRGSEKISPATSPEPQGEEDVEMSERGRFVQGNKDHPGANNNRGTDPEV